MAKSDLPVVYDAFRPPPKDDPSCVIDCSKDKDGNDCPSMTVESEAEECDINFILNRFLKTGYAPEMRPGVFGDATEVPASYHDAMTLVARATEQFMTVPPHIREKFGNDPAVFLDAVLNPARKQEMIDLKVFAPDEIVGDSRPLNVPVVGSAEAPKAPNA